MRRTASTLAALFTTAVLVGCGGTDSGQATGPGEAGTTATSGTGQPSTAASASTSSASASDGRTSSAARQPVPPKLRFTAETLDGATFEGTSLAGKPAVLWFWAPWCPNCRAEAPAVAKAAREHKSVTFVGVPSRSEAAAMRDFVNRFGVGGFPHLDDTSGEIWSRFGVTYQPAYAFISQDGTVDVVKRNLSEEAFAQRVERLAS